MAPHPGDSLNDDGEGMHVHRCPGSGMRLV